jgi:DNA-binding transcriptional MerR regulator
MQATETAHGGKAALDKSLKDFDLTRVELQNYLTWQLQLLRFIDLRFRPAVQVTNEDIEKYYQDNKVGEKLSDVRSQIEQKLSGERVDEQLDQWLRQSRSHTMIRFEDASLAPQPDASPRPDEVKK